jgi:uncharacterized protein (DUF433 family)
MFREELVAERIQQALPHLTAAQIHAALSCWRENEKAIALEIEEERYLAKLAAG